MDQVGLMDRMYKVQRHFYDLTRKYYLLGRDRLIRQLDLKPTDHCLEVACGTARNLVLVAKRYPDAKLYGLDASNEMLKTAQKKLERRGLAQRIKLVQCLAGELHHEKTFGHPKKFDVIFFSYGLSMIPPWQEALDVALDNLKDGGKLYIVDFWDQGGLPRWFQKLLKAWLKMFHVQHRPELLTYIESLAASGKVDLHLEPVGKRYAYIAHMTKKPAAAVAVPEPAAAQLAPAGGA